MKSASKITGLRYWMERVLEECEHVSADFSADPVHDLRVALRRCRSMADGMIAMDPDREWKAMKKAGKALFQSLGNLRDVQIMMEWIEKLHPARTETATGVATPVPASSGEGTDNAGAARVDITRSDTAAHALFQILRGREIEQKRVARAALEEFDSTLQIALPLSRDAMGLLTVSSTAMDSLRK